MNSLEAFKEARWIMDQYPKQFVKEGIELKTVEGYPLDKIEKDLEILETFRKILKENHNAQRIDNCVFAKSDTETYFGLGDDAIIVKNEDVEKIEHWFYEGERE